MWCWNQGTVGGWEIFGMVLMVLFWIAIIVLAIWGIKRFSQGTATITNKDAALDIASHRYAKGEISKAEYEQIKRDLS
ncbi:SHOCT domain-containing protein [Chloroflexota bacterium]